MIAYTNHLSFFSFLLDGFYGQWSNWSYVAGTTCSATCGTGQQAQERTRVCIPPQNGGKPCEGEARQIQFADCQNVLPECIGKFLLCMK